MPKYIASASASGWVFFMLTMMILLVLGVVTYKYNNLEHKYKASQLELADAYEAHANLIIQHVLTMDSLALCVAIVNPPPHPIPTEAAALFSEYIEQH
jgi:hypothetical protein